MIVTFYHYHDSTGAYHDSEYYHNSIYRMSLKLCVHRLAIAMFVIMQQIHLSTLEKILYFNMQLSGQDYNV